MKKPTLLILAAGIGSRYGGLKQIDKIGPSGEAIIDYSIFDAMRAGFGKVVMVIRKELEADFRDFFDDKIKGKLSIQYVYQELDNLPEGVVAPAGRVKPWGTAHAVLVASEVINEPFMIINADDFYGMEAYQSIVQYFTTNNIAVMVGGSGLYIDAVLNGIDEMPDHDPEIREYVNELYEKNGIEYLRHELLKHDPEYYKIVDLKNQKRAIINIGINVDMIIQNLSKDGKTDFSFTVNRSEYIKTVDLLRNTVLPSLGAEEVVGDTKICKVSIVGIGMRSHVGVASTMFRVLSEEGINCLLYTSDAADDLLCVDLGGRRLIKKKHIKRHTYSSLITKQHPH